MTEILTKKKTGLSGCTHRIGAWMARAFTSPTLMTVLNTAAKVLSFALVLPLVLRQFSAGDIALYYLFASVISLQMLIGSGFVPTFARFVSHALAGIPKSELGSFANGTDRSARSTEETIDSDLLAEIEGTLRRIFLVLSLISLPVMGVIGTALLINPVRASSSLQDSWIAWAIVVAVTPFSVYAYRFSALLQGANQIAMEQRWSALFTLAGSFLGLAALLFGGGLLSLIVVNQSMQLASFFRLSWLASCTLKRLPYRAAADRYSFYVFRAVWPTAWRSLVGVMSASGISSASGLVFAQRLSPEAMSEFLLGVRLMSVVAEISRAPFYSKIPVFNRLRAQRAIPALEASFRHSMILAHVGFISLFMAIPASAAIILPLVQSTVAFPDMGFWTLLGLAVFVERWGAMHLQIYSTTNHIIWHWLNGVTGLLWIFLMLVIAPFLGVFSYPLGMLIAYTVFYSRIAVQKSLSSIQCKFWPFERRCSAPALLALTMCCVCLMFIRILFTPGVP